MGIRMDLGISIYNACGRFEPDFQGRNGLADLPGIQAEPVLRTFPQRDTGIVAPVSYSCSFSFT